MKRMWNPSAKSSDYSLSYAHSLQKHPVFLALKQEGFSTPLDDLKFGENWSEVIGRKFDQAAGIVALVDRAFLDSTACRTEYTLAAIKRRLIVVNLIDGTGFPLPTSVDDYDIPIIRAAGKDPQEIASELREIISPTPVLYQGGAREEVMFSKQAPWDNIERNWKQALPKKMRIGERRAIKLEVRSDEFQNLLREKIGSDRTGFGGEYVQPLGLVRISAPLGGLSNISSGDNVQPVGIGKNGEPTESFWSANLFAVQKGKQTICVDLLAVTLDASGIEVEESIHQAFYECEVSQRFTTQVFRFATWVGNSVISAGLGYYLSILMQGS